MRFGTIGPRIDHRDAAANLVSEIEAAIHTARMDTSSQAIGRVIRKRQSAVVSIDAIETCDWSEQFALRDIGVRRHALDDRRLKIEARGMSRARQTLATEEQRGAFGLRFLDSRQHIVELALIDDGPEIVVVTWARLESARGRQKSFSNNS